MRKIAQFSCLGLSVALFAWAAYLLLSAPAEPSFDWMSSMTEAEYHARKDALMLIFRNAAFIVTWAIQLGFLGWILSKWQENKARSGNSAS